MALSQKHFGKMLVPWFNSQEWKCVYDLIYSKENTAIKQSLALGILRMWKSRTRKLPKGVEGTLIILDALHQDPEAVSEENLCLLYGTSIMRFLNICGANSERQGSFYQMAKKNNLPDWLVNLRHDLAHDQTIPSKYMLQLGLKFCLDWLQQEYWEKQNDILLDLIVEEDKHKEIQLAVTLYCNLNLVAAVSPYISTLEQVLHDNDTVQVVNELQDFVEISETMKIKDVCNLLLDKIKASITNDNREYLAGLIADVLIKNKSIFLMPNTPQNSDSKPKNILSAWEELLKLLYSENMLQAYIKKLVIMTNADTNTMDVTYMGVMWLTELFKGLSKAKIMAEKFAEMKTEAEIVDIALATTVLKSVVEKEYSNLKNAIDFDFLACEETINQVISLKPDVLKKPHCSMVNFFLELCDSPKKYINDIEILNQCATVVKTDLDIDDSVYTIEDLPHFDFEIAQVSKNESTMNIMSMDHENYCPSLEVMDTARTLESTEKRSRWKQVKDTSEFQGCPLGVLPHESTLINPFLLQYIEC